MQENKADKIPLLLKEGARRIAGDQLHPLVKGAGGILPLGNLLSVNLPDVNLIVFSIDDVSIYNRQGNVPG